MSKSKKSRKAAKPALTFIVVQGVDAKLKAKYRAAGAKQEKSMSAWIRDTLARAVR